MVSVIFMSSRARTDDIMLAKHALYQLSYGPLNMVEVKQQIANCTILDTKSDHLFVRDNRKVCYYLL